MLNRNFQLSLVFHTYLIFYENKRMVVSTCLGETITLLICCEQVYLLDYSTTRSLD